MPKLLDDMRSLLTIPATAPKVGEVVEAKENSVVVKTISGLREYRVLSPFQFKEGDRVKLNGDIAVAKVTSAGGLPHFQV